MSYMYLPSSMRYCVMVPLPAVALARLALGGEAAEYENCWDVNNEPCTVTAHYYLPFYLPSTEQYSTTHAFWIINLLYSGSCRRACHMYYVRRQPTATGKSKFVPLSTYYVGR